MAETLGAVPNVFDLTVEREGKPPVPNRPSAHTRVTEL